MECHEGFWALLNSIYASWSLGCHLAEELTPRIMNSLIPLLLITSDSDGYPRPKKAPLITVGVIEGGVALRVRKG